MSCKQKKILAVASGGGHWIQLLRIRPAFEGFKVEYMTTNVAYSKEVTSPLYIVTDANLWDKLKLVKMFLEVALVIIKVRPDVVLTTGAAPGFAAVFFGHILGARTVWIDSIANSEQLSNSGKKVGWFTDKWLTQWPLLAKENGPVYWGSIL